MNDVVCDVVAIVAVATIGAGIGLLVRSIIRGIRRRRALMAARRRARRRRGHVRIPPYDDRFVGTRPSMIPGHRVVDQHEPRPRPYVHVLAVLTAVVVIAASMVTIARGAMTTTEGGGGGGYGTLPTCGPVYYGVSLYVLHHMWTCVHGTPDHWRLDS